MIVKNNKKSLDIHSCLPLMFGGITDEELRVGLNSREVRTRGSP
jgi:hypothetical protein